MFLFRWLGRSLQWIFWLAATFALIWFAATVPLGDKTLFEHMRAIASTKEAKDLASGTKERAEDLARKVRGQLGDEGKAAKPPPPPPAKPAPAR